MKRLLLAVVIASPLNTPLSYSQQLEEVVVTAQRREQSLQDVPVSVTAFGADAIQKLNITSAIDYLDLTPNVSYTEDGQAGKRGAGISVRGVNNLVSGENAVVPSIGVYLDEFSVASVPTQFANPQLPDMARIEVLRGPQGTLFGRNAVGGTLNLTTQDPTDEFEARITVGGETYENAGRQYSGIGVINMPVSDTFKLRAVVNYEDNTGYVKNICAAGDTQAQCPIAAENNFTPNGASDSGHEYLSLRLKGIWDVSDRTRVMGTLIYADEEQGHDENVPSGILDLDSVDTFGIEQAQDPGTGFFPNNQNRLSHDLPEHNKLDTTLAILNVQHQFSDTTTLKWISGIIDAEFDRFFDNDLIGGLDAIFRTNLYEGTSWSSELRLETSTDRIDWVVGAIYSDDQQDQENKVGVSTNPSGTVNGVGVLPPFPQGLGLALNTKSFNITGYALFADMTMHMNDRLDLILGARYSSDEVEESFQGFGIGPGPDSCPPPVDIVCFFQGFVNSARPVAQGKESFDDFAPRLGFRYQATDDINVYGMISKGYKAGGLALGNNTNADGQPALAVPYDQEELWSYELGFKSELLNRRLRLNGAIFYSDWSDMQFEAFRFLTPGDLSSNFEQTINIDQAEAFGVELEFQALITENFTLSGGFGWLDTEISDSQDVEITGGFKVRLDGLELPKAPELSYNLAADYRWKMMEQDAWARLEFVHRDGQYSDIEGLTNRQTRGPSPNSGLTRPVGPGEFPFLSPDYDVFNFRAGWDSERWGFQVYVENMFEEDFYTGTQENFGVSGIRLRPHPRIMGANIYFAL